MKQLFAIILILYSLPAPAQKQGQPLIDSILRELPRLKDDTNKVKLISRLAYAYQDVNPDEGARQGQAALALAQNLEWKKGIGLADNALGENYEAKSDYAKSLEYHFKALKINEDIGDKRETAISMEDIAFTYQDQSDHVSALDYNFKALTIFEELGDKEGKAAIAGAIGSCYQSEKDYAKALEYHMKSLKLHKEIANKKGMAANMGNIGIVYERQGNSPQALVYDVMALEMYTGLDDKSGEERNLGNIGNIYTNLHQYSQGLEYDLKALNIAQELDDKNIMGANFGNIGELYLMIVKDTAQNTVPGTDAAVYKAANLKKAIEYLNKGVSICTEIGLLDAVIEFRQSLSEAYTLSGDSKAALENYKISTTLKDSLFSGENKMKIAQMGDKYEQELKDRDAQIAQLSAVKKHNEQIFLIVGGCLLIVLIGVVLRKAGRK